MSTWNVDVQVLHNGEEWPGQRLKLWIRWPGPFGGTVTHFDAYGNDDGHATFEIEDDDDRFDDDTPIAIAVSIGGDDYEFGPYTLGGGGYTIDITDDMEPETVSPDDL